jgi:DNA primase large subunit
MIRQDFSRVDAKRKTGVDYRKKQFATPTYASLEYKSRLNFYVTPPTADITLEQFEQWAIDRLRGMFLPSFPSLIQLRWLMVMGWM